MNTKTPQEIAQTIMEQEFGAQNVAPNFRSGDTPQMAIVRRTMLAAILADRAQFFDTAGSASSQHYIDTGRYLLHEEVAEMERVNGE